MEVYRKLEMDYKSRRKIKHNKIKVIEDHYYYQGTYERAKDLIELHTDTILVALEDSDVELAYVPTVLFDQYRTKVKKRRLETTMEALARVFPLASKLSLRVLAEGNCRFQEFKMNTTIYRLGQEPDYCYVLT